MSTRVDPRFAVRIKEYGTVSIEKCFNCGNCTAVCSMSSNEAQFPRRIIRMAQVGMRDQLLGSKELWLCYNCASARKRAPSRPNPPIHGGRTPLRNCELRFDRIREAPRQVPLVGGLIAFLMVLFFAAFMYTQRETMSTESLKLFNFIPYGFIHTAGIVDAGLVGIVPACWPSST